METKYDATRQTHEMDAIPLDELQPKAVDQKKKSSLTQPKPILYRDASVTPHDWTYDHVMSNPKGDHGIVAVPRTSEARFPSSTPPLTNASSSLCSSSSSSPRSSSTSIVPRVHWHKDIFYGVLETGGFLRIWTPRGRVYWNAQNSTSHTTPDWKVHFSVRLEDLGKAWDLLHRLFMSRRGEVGMKVVSQDQERFCSGPQRGREVTVYIYQYDPTYRAGPAYFLDDDGCEIFFDASEVRSKAKRRYEGSGSDSDDTEDYGSSGESSSDSDSEHIFRRQRLQGDFLECDLHLAEVFGAPYTSEWWKEFLHEAEKLLIEAGVESNGGVAEGDLPLPGFRYASLRNEAFVKLHPEDEFGIYPPNHTGWNAVGHPIPDAFKEIVVTVEEVNH